MDYIGDGGLSSTEKLTWLRVIPLRNDLKIHHEQYSIVVKDYLWFLRDLSSSLDSGMYYDLQ